MNLLHEFLTWLSQEGLAREGLYIVGVIVLVIVLKGGTESCIDFIFFRKGKNNEKNN